MPERGGAAKHGMDMPDVPVGSVPGCASLCKTATAPPGHAAWWISLRKKRLVCAAMGGPGAVESGAGLAANACLSVFNGEK